MLTKGRQLWPMETEMTSYKKQPQDPKPVKLPPSAPEARDAGPRLIPLDYVEHAPRVQYHLELADVALGTRPPEPKRQRARRNIPPGSPNGSSR